MSRSPKKRKQSVKKPLTPSDLIRDTTCLDHLNLEVFDFVAKEDPSSRKKHDQLVKYMQKRGRASLETILHAWCLVGRTRYLDFGPAKFVNIPRNTRSCNNLVTKIPADLLTIGRYYLYDYAIKFHQDGSQYTFDEYPATYKLMAMYVELGLLYFDEDISLRTLSGFREHFKPLFVVMNLTNNIKIVRDDKVYLLPKNKTAVVQFISLKMTGKLLDNPEELAKYL